jgi:hypothetical protein
MLKEYFDHRQIFCTHCGIKNRVTLVIQRINICTMSQEDRNNVLFPKVAPLDRDLETIPSEPIIHVDVSTG